METDPFRGSVFCRNFFWQNYTKKIKMGIDKFAQVMYNSYNGRIWDIL